jgi:hypothetical protein
MEKRTQQQNRAIHKLFTELSEQLNDAGLDQRKVLKPSVDIPWTPEAVKEQLWRPIQRAMLLKSSTTELTTTDIDKVFDVLVRHLGEKFGIEIEFPSIEALIAKQQQLRRKK